MQNSLSNKVTLIGNLGSDTKIIKLENDIFLSRFSLATTEYYNDVKGAKRSKTNWHQIITWGKTAELVKNYLKKGQKVALSGKLISRSYKTENGEDRYTTEVQANDILMLSKKLSETNKQPF